MSNKAFIDDLRETQSEVITDSQKTLFDLTFPQWLLPVAPAFIAMTLNPLLGVFIFALVLAAVKRFVVGKPRRYFLDTLAWYRQEKTFDHAAENGWAWSPEEIFRKEKSGNPVKKLMGNKNA